MNPSAAEASSWRCCLLFSALVSPQPFRGDQRMLQQVLIPDCTEMFCCLEKHHLKDVWCRLNLCSILGSVPFWVVHTAKLFRGRNEGMWYGCSDFCTSQNFTALAANSFEMGETGPHQLWEGLNLVAGAQVMPPHPRVHTGIFLTSPTTRPKTRTASLHIAPRENRFAAGVGMFMHDTGLKHCCLSLSKRWD